MPDTAASFQDGDLGTLTLRLPQTGRGRTREQSEMQSDKKGAWDSSNLSR